VAFSVPPRLCGEGLALSILDNQENSLDNLAQAPHPKALRASLSRRPCTTKKRHSAETAGCRVSSSHLIEEQTPTYRCSSPGGANELSPGAEALGNHAEQHKSPVGGDTPIFFPACHPGQPRTTRNLTDRPVPPPATLAFSYTTSHPHAIQVSGHEFTRAVRMNKTPFPCAAGSRAAQRRAKSCAGPPRGSPAGFRIAPPLHDKKETPSETLGVGVAPIAIE
jgi:hypothetical protein